MTPSGVSVPGKSREETKKKVVLLKWLSNILGVAAQVHYIHRASDTND